MSISILQDASTAGPLQNRQSVKSSREIFCSIHLCSNLKLSVLFIAGGKDKHISFDELHDYDERVKHCFAFGQTKEKIAEQFTRSTIVETMFEALQEAYKIAAPGDVVLLSPACSSYDQFDNYEQRGDLFKEAVMKL